MFRKIFLNLIKFYQLLISPFLGNHCRFHPSCSEYTRQSVEKYGALKGCRRGLTQLLKCHSWNF